MSARIYENNNLRLKNLLKAYNHINLNKFHKKNGNTLLHIAVLCDNKECVKLLIKYGIAINIQNYKGNTALHIAIANYSNIIADYLIKVNAD